MQPSECFTPSHLLRVGECRKAALACLRELRLQGCLSFELPESLLKSKRFKLALKFSIELAIAKPGLIHRLSYIISSSLPYVVLTLAEVDGSLALFRGIAVDPKAVAIISSGFVSVETRNEFLDKCFQVFSFTAQQKLLAHAYLAYHLGDHHQSISIAQRLLDQDCSNIEACNIVAGILCQENYTYQARRFACCALRLDRSNPLALEILGHCLHKESKWRAARKVFGLLHAITGDDISLANALTAMPTIASSCCELSRAVTDFNGLSNYIDGSWTFIGVEESLRLCGVHLPSAFFLPYQGPVSVRESLEASREFFRRSAQSLLADINKYYRQLSYSSLAIVNHVSRAHRPASRIKIAFVSRFFSLHSNLEAHYGLIENLDRDVFEVVLVHRPGGVVDSAHHRLNQCADSVVYLSPDFGDNYKVLRSLDLDIAFFTDIGMVALDCILPMSRIARVQVTSWGLPHTTGLKEIDYYFRSVIFRDCENQEQYTESLFETSGYIGYFDYSRYPLRVLSRDYFLLPPDRFLVGCLQSVHKIHPDFDQYLEEIAQIDESIMIVMSPSEHDSSMERFMKRLRRSAPTAYRQLCIVSRTSLDDFFSLNHLLDLNLDTIYYGSGITFIQTTWCGPPYITEKSCLVRSSVVASSYAYAGIDNPPVSSGKNHYVELVRKYFMDSDARISLRSEIHDKCQGSIYNNSEYVRSCQDALVAVLEDWHLSSGIASAA